MDSENKNKFSHPSTDAAKAAFTDTLNKTGTEINVKMGFSTNWRRETPNRFAKRLHIYDILLGYAN